MWYRKMASCVVAVFITASFAAAPARCGTIGPITLALTPNGEYDNQLSLTISFPSVPCSDTQPSFASGAMLVNLDATFDPTTHAATVSGIGFIPNDPYDSGQPAISFSDMTFSYPDIGTTLTATDMKGSIGTPNPPGLVTNGSFSGDLHKVNINSGVFTASGGFEATLPLDEFWVRADSSGTGSVTVGDPIIDGNLATYSVEVLMPFQFIDEIDEIGATTAAGGMIRATGSFTQVIPEPGTFVMMLGCAMGLVIYGWLRRR